MPPKKNDSDVLEEEEDPLEAQMLKEELLNVEINMLGDRYGRCEARCSELQEINKKLEYDLLTQKEDQVDIFTYLNTELSKRVEQVASLENQIQAMALAQEKWEKETEQEFATIRADHEQIIEDLNKKVDAYKGELEDLQDFTKHKNALEQKLRDVETELSQNHDRHLISLTDLERKHSQDREKIKRDYHERLEADKGELLYKINKQLEFTTRRTMHENDMMTSELSYQNKQTERIIRNSEDLSKEQQAMKRETELLKQAEERLVMKNHKFQKTIKQLQIKLAAYEADSTKIQSIEADAVDAKHQEMEAARESINVLNEKLQGMRHKHILATKECDSLKSQLEDSRKEIKRMRELKDEAQQFLFECLEDARKEFSVQLNEKTQDWKSEDPIPWSLKGLSKVGREALLEYLLSRMGGSHLLDRSRSSTGRHSSMKIRTNSPSNGANSPSLKRTTEVNKEPVLPPISGTATGDMQSPQTTLMGTWGSKQYPKQSASPTGHLAR